MASFVILVVCFFPQEMRNTCWLGGRNCMSYVTDASLYSSHEEVFNWEIKFCEATSLFESVASVKVDFIRV